MTKSEPVIQDVKNKVGRPKKQDLKKQVAKAEKLLNDFVPPAKGGA